MNRHLKNILLVFILTLVAIVGVLIYRLGFNKKVEFTEVRQQSFIRVYKKHFGPYHEIVKTIEAVEAWAKTHNLPCSKSFGEYLDDPERVPTDRLRSLGGCLLQAPLDPEVLLPEEFYTDELKPQNFLKAQFAGSPASGPFVVYPQAREWLAQRGQLLEFPVIEVYEIFDGGKSMETSYYFLTSSH